MWIYAQKTGELQLGNEHIDNGYSGFQEGKNNPDMQAVENVGPIPQGDWAISGPPRNTSEHGPVVLTLTAANGTNTFGRSEFLIPGDSIEHPGEASKGCIIMRRTTREKVWNSGDRDLSVVTEFTTQDAVDSRA